MNLVALGFCGFLVVFEYMTGFGFDVNKSYPTGPVL